MVRKCHTKKKSVFLPFLLLSPTKIQQQTEEGKGRKKEVSLFLSELNPEDERKCL